MFLKLGCRYERGTWSECDVKLQLQKRVDHIKERFKGPECTDTRVITKKCETNDKKGMPGILNQILFEKIYLFSHFRNYFQKFGCWYVRRS